MATGDVLDRAATSSSGLAGNSADAEGEVWGVLPRQHDPELAPKKWSVERETQLNEILAAGLNAVVRPGVLTGGEVTAGAGLTVEVAADTRIWIAGMVFRLNVAAVFNDVDDDTDTTVWGTIDRAPADAIYPAQLDQYSFQMVNSPTSPGGAFFPVAIVTAVGGAVTAVVEPSGKYCFKRTWEQIETMALSSSGSFDVDHSAEFIRFMIGHTPMVYVDQDNVTVEIDPHSVTPEGFTVNWTTGGAPGTNEYGTNTEVRMLFDCYGHFFDL